MKRRNITSFLGLASVAHPMFAATPAAPLVLAGSTSGQSLLKEWASKFAGGAAYGGGGSGAGIQGVGNGSVDIGFTDFPLTALALSQQQLVQLPLFGDGIVLMANLPSAAELKIGADTLVDIYRGGVRDVGKSSIALANPKVKLESTQAVAHARKDASGSTRTFSAFMSLVSRSWAKEFSSDFRLRWPTSVIEVQGTSGMVAAVKAKPGAFGYAGLAEARAAGLGLPQISNLGGTHIAPSLGSVQAALNGAVWDPASNAANLQQVTGAQAWPISFAVYALFKRTNPKVADIRAMLARVTAEGQPDIARLGFGNIPAAPRTAMTERAMVV